MTNDYKNAAMALEPGDTFEDYRTDAVLMVHNALSQEVIFRRKSDGQVVYRDTHEVGVVLARREEGI